MNIERIQEVSDALLASPSYFSMEDWEIGSGENRRRCIGGIARELHPELCGKSKVIEDKLGLLMAEYVDACYILGVTERQADSLFFLSGWPSSYREMYAEADGDLERAVIAKSRIRKMVSEA